MTKTTTLNILQRLAAVQNEVDYIQKEKKAGMKYSIVSHDAVTAKVRPLMVKHGVLYYPLDMDITQVGNRTQARMMVRFANVDDRADFIDVVSAGYGIDDQDKGPGKAISYSVKYALLKVLGLESGDDPDEDQVSVHNDPANPDIIAITQFLADAEAAADYGALTAVGATHAAAMQRATAAFPAKAQSARSAYAARLSALKAAANTSNGATN